MKAIYTLPLIALVAACGQSGADYQPILDGAPSASFQSDLSACQGLAHNQKQFGRETMGAVAIGAGLGAVLGEADSDISPLGGAVVGALAAGGATAAEADEKRQSIVVECMRGRGHRVVG